MALEMSPMFLTRKLLQLQFLNSKLLDEVGLREAERRTWRRRGGSAEGGPQRQNRRRREHDASAPRAVATLPSLLQIPLPHLCLGSTIYTQDEVNYLFVKLPGSYFELCNR
jgi:hypothetical protein